MSLKEEITLAATSLCGYLQQINEPDWQRVKGCIDVLDYLVTSIYDRTAPLVEREEQAAEEQKKDKKGKKKKKGLTE